MSIVSSSFALDGHAQADGRRYVTETHTDNLGFAWFVTYLAAAGTDYAAVMTARATVVAAALETGEFVNALAIDATPTFRYLTAAQAAFAFREIYRTASQLDAARMATWLLNRIDDGTWTDAQVRNAFGLTTTQYNNQKAALTTLRTEYNACIAAQGV